MLYWKNFLEAPSVGWLVAIAVVAAIESFVFIKVFEIVLRSWLPRLADFNANTPSLVAVFRPSISISLYNHLVES
ncbi:hypothetical protein ACOSP7_015124 [Xanthoceras sorbifolium]